MDITRINNTRLYTHDELKSQKLYTCHKSNFSSGYRFENREKSKIHIALLLKMFHFRVKSFIQENDSQFFYNTLQKIYYSTEIKDNFFLKGNIFLLSRLSWRFSQFRRSKNCGFHSGFIHSH